MYAKKEKIYPTFVSKHNSDCEKKVILLMIWKREKRKAKSKGGEAKSKGWRIWHYLPAKKLSALLRRITSKHYSDFCCLNCLHSFSTKNKLESHKKVCKIKIFVM